MIGATGTATSVVLGAAGVSAWLAGAAGGLAAGLTDGYFAGEQDAGALVAATAFGGAAGSLGENISRGPGRQPNKWVSRKLSNYGPNSMRVLKGESVGDILSGAGANVYNALHESIAGGDCGCH